MGQRRPRPRHPRKQVHLEGQRELGSLDPGRDKRHSHRWSKPSAWRCSRLRRSRGSGSCQPKAVLMHSPHLVPAAAAAVPAAATAAAAAAAAAAHQSRVDGTHSLAECVRGDARRLGLWGGASKAAASAVGPPSGSRLVGPKRPAKRASHGGSSMPAPSRPRAARAVATIATPRQSPTNAPSCAGSCASRLQRPPP
jgi:hypothetical protein